MVKINLFPIKEAKRNYLTRLTIVSNVIIFGVVIGIFALIFIFNSMEISELDGKIVSNKKKLEELKQLKVQLKKFQSDKEIIETKFKIINDLDSMRIASPYVLYQFSKSIPEKLWFTKLNINETSISLDGIGMDEPTIVDFIKNLKKIKIFSKVDLIQVSQIKVKDYKFKSFSINILFDTNKIRDIH